MVDILLGVLADAKPPISSVIDCREVTHRDLSVVEIRYVQGNSYIAARSYTTGSWIAKTPLGPTLNEDGTLCINSIQDIAEVSTYASANDLRRRQWPDVDHLIQVQQGLDKAALKFVQEHYPVLKNVLHRATFTFSPFPVIQVCLATGTSYKKLLGTLAIDTRGGISITSKTIPEVEDFVLAMRSAGYLPVSKELYHE